MPTQYFANILRIGKWYTTIHVCIPIPDMACQFIVKRKWTNVRHPSIPIFINSFLHRYKKERKRCRRKTKKATTTTKQNDF